MKFYNSYQVYIEHFPNPIMLVQHQHLFLSVNQEDILEIIEKAIIEMVTEVFPKKKFTQVPFPRLNYEDVMKKLSPGESGAM